MIDSYPSDQNVVEILSAGGVIAYPTEAVYGFGCDPFNRETVERLLALKKRPVSKGLILLVSSWQQVTELTQPVEEQLLEAVKATWPGPATWVFPASEKIPIWIKGEHESIALRMSAHLQTKKLVEAFASPLVSTSANFTGQEPVKTYEEARELFASQIDLVLPGEVGNLNQPTTIRDVMTDKVFR